MYTTLKPMRVGEILDRTFYVYRKQFMPLFLLMLLIFGPLYLLQNFLLFDFTSMSILPQYSGYEDLPWYERALEGITGPEPFIDGSIWKPILYFLVVLPLMLLAATPIAISAVLFFVQSIMDGEKPILNTGIKQAFSRFWPLVGSTTLFWLIIGGMYMVLIILFSFSTLISVGGMAALFDEEFGGPVFSSVAFGIIVGLFIAAAILTPLYFMLRWGFYLPVVAVEKRGVGLGKSWNLTKGNFWRLVAIFLVLFIVTGVLTAVLQGIFSFLLGGSIIGQLLMDLISILFLPFIYVAYAFAYFDLRVRNDAIDLEQMMESVENER